MQFTWLERQSVSDEIPEETPEQVILRRLDLFARSWADTASPAELRAWLTACFLRLPKREQASFLAAAKGRIAA